MMSDTSPRQPPRLRWPVLKPVGGDPDSPFVRVNRSTCIVGDRSPVHLPLRSPLVSRTHALIVVDEDEVYVRDLASSNRLYVNGSAAREASLRPADLLQIGPFRFRCYAGFPQSRREAEQAGVEQQASLVLAGSEKSRRLHSRTFVIGRREECDLPLNSNAVSNVHAVIFRRGTAHFIRDLNSRMGTVVNGRKVREAELKDGDELRIATAMLRFRLEAVMPAESADEAMAEASGSWLAAELWSSSTGGLSVSRSVGAQTIAASSPEALAGQPPEPLNLEAPAATAEDLGLTDDGSFTPGANVEVSTDFDLATSAELFSSEINLPGGRIFNPAYIKNPQPPRNGNGRKHQ